MLTRLYTKFQVARNEEGATAIEYGLLAALIAVGIILAVIAVADGLNATFGSVSDELVAPAAP